MGSEFNFELFGNVELLTTGSVFRIFLIPLAALVILPKEEELECPRIDSMSPFSSHVGSNSWEQKSCFEEDSKTLDCVTTGNFLILSLFELLLGLNLVDNVISEDFS